MRCSAALVRVLAFVCTLASSVLAAALEVGATSTSATATSSCRLPAGQGDALAVGAQANHWPETPRDEAGRFGLSESVNVQEAAEDGDHGAAGLGDRLTCGAGVQPSLPLDLTLAAAHAWRPHSCNTPRAPPARSVLS